MLKGSAMSRKRIKGRSYNCPKGCKTWEECEQTRYKTERNVHGDKIDDYLFNCICWEWFEHIVMTDIAACNSKKNKKHE